ncbi:DUF3396 domain-containing protein [Archangium sp.]|uniref:DUF3396 domain-containing protein n=1 Tax=Archangium sp. TaxID=1872627 RepID=UPI002D2464CB|nr:DUF3396 domain-containing protein [Archangium sp.]HYO54407.1 DUF3396 domain-containing protein [Archangium sp.]
MSEHYPRIRIRVESGALMIREALSINFYMRHSHAVVAQAVMRALEIYLRALGGGPELLSRYSHEAGAWRRLDEARWERTRHDLLNKHSAIIHLWDASSGEKRYRFAYHGRPIDKPLPWENEADMVCAVSFWLPTEYLEEHSPGRVRELALELAGPLPFCSGHAGLAFNCEMDVVGVPREVRKLCFRYPGMDIPDPHLFSFEMGTRVRGVSWLTFLGQPVLGEMGGAAGLRSRLSSPGTTVQEMEGERAVITLGLWPEAGDTERGDMLPTYQELARVLEPWLFHEKPLRSSAFTPEDLLRWERRFLD